MSSAAQKSESLTTNTEALTRRAETINSQPKPQRSCFEVVIRSCLLGCVLAPPFIVRAADEVSPAEARAIAMEAYIYGFSMVDGYRIQYAYFVDRINPEFKASWNQIRNVPRVFTPDDKVVQIPNSDTPYSTLGLDLRAEPIVITVPPIEKSRYFSVQLIDLYTFNFGYIGSRTTGSVGGNFLVAGPSWKGAQPPGINRVFQCETEFALAGFRTQLFNPGDLDNVKKVQAGYNAQPLSQFLGKPAPPAAPRIDFIKPLTPDQERTLPQFFNILNFVLPRPQASSSVAGENSGLAMRATVDFIEVTAAQERQMGRIEIARRLCDERDPWTLSGICNGEMLQLNLLARGA